MTSPTLFQYCQKLVVFSGDKTKVLLAKRKGEADYDGVFSFIGGKMETTDVSVLAGMKREKDEEIGSTAHIKVLPAETYSLLFRKKDGNSMIVAHVAAVFLSGDIVLSEEYSEYQWVVLEELADFEPKITNIPEITNWAKERLDITDPAKLIEL